jgi:hypothetical protein
MDTTGKDFVEHWDWAAEKGGMKKNTANALRAACSQVLEVVDNWETVDIRELDVENTLTRFENLKGKDYKPQTLNAYMRRFRLAVNYFLEYIDDPSGWKPPATRDRSSRKSKSSEPEERSSSRPSSRTISSLDSKSHLSGENLVEYPYPLRENLVIYLHLPADLKSNEVKKLAAFMTTLTVDFEVGELFS